ncbi:hypothetical protein ACSFBF_06995 [Variovorax sp. ZT5P49]|uniref:hypothetical protein n=1 Tax=Variovorax sp. ZT5P49 TaxID=3443733 RepID=UPI003F46663B
MTYQPAHSELILAAMTSGVPMTAVQIAQASGVSVGIVATYMPRLCMAAKATCVNRKRPMQYQLAGAPAEAIVSQARRTQPVSVFDMARLA